MPEEIFLTPLTSKAGAIWGSEWQAFNGISGDATGSSEYTANPASYSRAAVNNAWVARCLDLRGSAICEAPLCVYEKGKDGKYVEVVDHPAAVVLDRANDKNWYAGDLLKRASIASLDLHGHFAWQLGLNSSGIPVEIYFIPPTVYRPFGDGQGYFAGIKLRDQNQREREIPKSQLVYDVSMSLLDPVSGSSRIAAMRQDLNLHQYSMSSNLYWHRNNQEPDWILTGDFAPTNENVANIRRQIAQWSGGPNKRGPLIFGGGTMNAHLFRPNAKDLEWLGAIRMSQETIAAGFGVPTPLLNYMEHATLANVDAYQRIFWTHTCIPEFRQIARSWTIKYLWRWPDARQRKLIMGFDFNRVIALAEDNARIWEREMQYANVLINGAKEGGMTPNQWRAAMVPVVTQLGLDPTPFQGDVPQGDDRMINWNSIPSQQAGAATVIDIMLARGPNSPMIQNLPEVPVDFEGAADQMLADQAERAAASMRPQPGQGGGQGDSQKPPAKPAPSKALPAPEPLRLTQKAMPNPLTVRDARLAKVQDRMTRRMKAWFQDRQKETLRTIRNREKAVEPQPDDASYWDAEAALLALNEIANEAVLDSATAAYEAASVDFGLNVAWDSANSWLPLYMGKRLPLIHGIADTLRGALQSTLLEGAQAGESIPDLSGRVTDVFKDAIGNRAATIARTETLQAYGSASLAAYNDAGVQKAQMYDGDNDDSADCAAVNGSVVTLDEAEMLMNEEHPNGTRGVAPYVELPVSLQTAEMVTATARPAVAAKTDFQSFMEYQQKRDGQMFELFARALETRTEQPDIKIDLPAPAPITIQPAAVTVSPPAVNINIPPGAVKFDTNAFHLESPVTVQPPTLQSPPPVAANAVEPVTLEYDDSEVEVVEKDGKYIARRKD